MDERLEHALNYCASTPKRCFVYVISDGEYFKVGIAIDVPLRLTTLQIGNARDLKLLVAWESSDAKASEDELHSKLGPYAVRGEWFRQTPESIAIVFQAVTGNVLPRPRAIRPALPPSKRKPVAKRRTKLRGYWRSRPYRSE